MAAFTGAARFVGGSLGRYAMRNAMPLGAAAVGGVMTSRSAGSIDRQGLGVGNGVGMAAGAGLLAFGGRGLGAGRMFTQAGRQQLGNRLTGIGARATAEELPGVGNAFNAVGRGIQDSRIPGFAARTPAPPGPVTNDRNPLRGGLAGRRRASRSRAAARTTRNTQRAEARARRANPTAGMVQDMDSFMSRTRNTAVTAAPRTNFLTRLTGRRVGRRSRVRSPGYEEFVRNGTPGASSPWSPPQRPETPMLALPAPAPPFEMMGGSPLTGQQSGATIRAQRAASRTQTMPQSGTLALPAPME